MLKKLKGFTMAEAILVMTILGIIATIMISTLKPAEYKEKALQIMAKKVLSELDVATTQVLMNDTVNGVFNEFIDPDSGDVFGHTGDLMEVENVSQQLTNLYKQYLTTLRAKTKTKYFHGAEPIILKDGASVSFSLYEADCSTIFPGETNVITAYCPVGWIRYDVNDNEPPNVYGKDRFLLPLGLHGIAYADETQ